MAPRMVGQVPVVEAGGTSSCKGLPDHAATYQPLTLTVPQATPDFALVPLQLSFPL